MKNIKVVIYSRVSTDQQAYLRQIEAITKYCKANEYTIVNEFCEKETGKHKLRPELTNMMDYLKLNPDVSFVVIDELSRIGRTSYVLQTIEQLNAVKIGLISLKENLTTLNEDKTVNATATMITGVLASINSYELDTLNYRIKSGLLSSAKNGRINGDTSTPYGYTKDEKRKMIINEDEALVVKKIFELSLTMGAVLICNYLNNKEVITKNNKKWRNTTVYFMLRNPIYKGERRYLDNVFDVPAIIDTEFFDKVQEHLTSKSNNQGKNQIHQYMLSKQMIQCGICGKFFAPHLRSGNKESVYKCQSKNYINESCGNNNVNVAKIEQAVTSLLIHNYGHSLNKKFNDSDEHITKISELKIEIEETEGFVKKQSKVEDNLIDLFSSGILNKTKLTEKLDVVKKEVLKLQNQIVNLKGQLDAHKNILNKKEAILFADGDDNHLKQLFQNKDILKSIVSSIVVYPSNRRLTTNSNEVCTRVEVTTTDGDTTNLYLSNYSKGNFNDEPSLPKFAEISVPE